MAQATGQHARTGRAFPLPHQVDWLEMRLRRLADSGAVRLWALMGMSLVVAWLPAVAGVPL